MKMPEPIIEPTTIIVHHAVEQSDGAAQNLARS